MMKASNEVPPRATGHSPTVDGLRAEVESLSGMMRENVNKLLERGERTDKLVNRSDDLEAASGQFRSMATRVHRRSCLHFWKWRLMLGGLVLLALTGALTLGIRHWNNRQMTIQTTTQPIDY